MSVHEISDVLHKYMSGTVKVVNIRIGFVCTVCGNEWGIRVDDEEELLRQAHKFICLPCYQNNLVRSAKGENNGYR